MQQKCRLRFNPTHPQISTQKKADSSNHIRIPQGKLFLMGGKLLPLAWLMQASKVC